MCTINIDFESVLVILDQDIKKKKGNYKCPFCGIYSFATYNDQKAKCHNASCKWYGDIIQLYSDIKNISRDKSFKELGINLEKNKIKFKAQSFEEALNELSNDLYFLSWVRMYFAFYSNDRVNQQYIANKLNITKSTLNKILNGNLGNSLTWRKIVNALKQEIPIEQLKKDLKLEHVYFKNKLEKDDQLYLIKKFRIKNKKGEQNSP